MRGKKQVIQRHILRIYTGFIVKSVIRLVEVIEQICATISHNCVELIDRKIFAYVLRNCAKIRG